MNKKKIKYFDLNNQYRSIKKDIDKKIIDVISSSQYVLGPEVSQFENDFSNYVDAKYGVGVNSGTSALHLSLLACGIGRGDEVITVSMTFIATAMAITYTGAKPVFVDIEAKSMTMDTSLIESKITSKTKAIVPVHLYGQCANIKEIKKIARKYNLYIIEDAAQAHGSRLHNIKAGSLGDIAAFSFYPGKNLGAYGESGIITTNNKKLFKKTLLLRDWGQSKKYHHEMISYNYRMDGIQGGILNVKLKKIREWTEKRRVIASRYQEAFLNSNINCTKEEKGRYHVYHIFSIFDNERESLKSYLNKNNIQTSYHYPVPVHIQKPYIKKYKVNSLPITLNIAKSQLSLPMYPEMKKSDQDIVIKYVLNWKNNNT